MPEGTLCNRTPIKTEAALKRLLDDTGGKAYYQEMKALEVDCKLLWGTLQKTLKSRLRTWLSLCAHCGMCADS
ncbi:MAG TPA: (Fe-S)-binding protein, partial [Desulfobacterales bacterium]|nr:(Fe-S)-binding protein [Desulfobacterales bacterium]